MTHRDIVGLFVPNAVSWCTFYSSTASSEMTQRDIFRFYVPHAISWSNATVPLIIRRSYLRQKQ